MGINKFIYLLFFCSFAFLMVDKKQEKIIIQDTERPNISFYNSVMYEITHTNVNQIVQSKEAYIYNNREELIDGIIIKRAKSDTNTTDTNLVNGDYITKIGNDVYIDGNVNLQFSNDINVKTEQLEYNLETTIAKNTMSFVMKQNDDSFYGRALFLDTQNKHIIAKDANIRIKVINE